MKKSIFTIILAFLMLFNLNSQGDTTKIDSVDNSLTVEVKFENPQLDVSINDQRDENYIDIFTQVLNNNLLSNNKLDGTLTQLDNHLANYMKTQQERRYESSMDYLIRKTSMKKQNIQNAINQYHKITMFTYFILTLLIIGIYISYFREHNKYERDWRYSVSKAIGLTIVLSFTYDILHSWLLYIFATNLSQSISPMNFRISAFELVSFSLVCESNNMLGKLRKIVIS